jgi:hypothetical protein
MLSFFVIRSILRLDHGPTDARRTRNTDGEGYSVAHSQVLRCCYGFRVKGRKLV